MSEQRRLRAELKQGLHQFLMTLYMSYKETASHDESLTNVREVIEEELKYFSDPSKSVNTSKEKEKSLTDYILSLEKKATKEENHDIQFQLHQELETLMSAQEIINKIDQQELTTT